MKTLKQFWKRKLDEDGFSLVELVIVIAVMAILIGIVGMTVLPQIENSRRATDAEILSALLSESMEAWTQVDACVNDMKFKVTVDVSDYSLIIAEDSEGSDADNAVYHKLLELEGVETSAGGKTGRKMKSSAGRGMEDIYIFFDAANHGGVYLSTEVIVSQGADVTPIEGFEDYEFQSR